MKQTTHTYTCDQCKIPMHRDNNLKEISIETPETVIKYKDFCSMNCFLKFFNTMMAEEKLDIRIAQGDDD
jgi:hypothetical protein